MNCWTVFFHRRCKEAINNCSEDSLKIYRDGLRCMGCSYQPLNLNTLKKLSLSTLYTGLTLEHSERNAKYIVVLVKAMKSLGLFVWIRGKSLPAVSLDDSFRLGACVWAFKAYTEKWCIANDGKCQIVLWHCAQWNFPITIKQNRVNL